MWRRLPWIVAIALGVAPLRAGMPPLLREACLKTSLDTDRWAYTETTVATDAKGHSRGETVVLVDPSKPYAEQFTPLKVNGKPPTERQLRKYREKGERRGRDLEQRGDGAAAGPGDGPVRVNVNGAPAEVDFDHITVVDEDPRTVTYEIPLRREAREGVPLEALQLRLRVNKEQRALEHVDIHLRQPVRVRLIARVKTGDIGLDFATVDPKFAPTLAAVHGDLAASVLFVPVAAKVEIKRTDFRRVTPYNDRFRVKVGPLHFISY